jgi:hypothetical protein
MNSRIRFTGMAFAAILFAFMAPAALRADSCTSASNLVQNCSFDTSDTNDWATDGITGWTLTKAADWSDFGIGGPPDSVSEVWFGAEDCEYDILSQTLSTTSGATYTLSFWLYDTYGDGPGSDTDFQALWHGVSVLDQYTTMSDFTEYTFTVTGTGSDTLTFEGYDAPDPYYLRDISVTEDANTVTPEPSSFLLLGTGLAGFAGMLKRRLAAGGRA